MDKRIPLPTAAGPLQDWTGPRLLAGIMLLACLALTGGLWRHAHVAAQQKLQAAFDARVHELVNTIAARMQTYIQVLHGVQGLYASSISVERDEFRRYVDAQQLEANVPGMRGLGYMQAVPGDKLAAHVAAMRAAGFPDYSVKPAGARALYAPIIYLEPFTGPNLRAFGFDPYAEAVRHVALDQARDSAEAVMTGKIRLVQDQPELVRYGFLIVLPVYDNALPHDTLAQRRAGLRGWVYAPFRCDDFMAGLGREHASRLDVEIYDGDSADPAQRMYDSAAGAAEALSLTSVQKLGIAGHRWTVAVGAHRDFGSGMADKPLLIAWGGLLVSVVLALLTWLLARSRSKARDALRQAGLLTLQLQQGQAGMQAMAETAQRSQTMLGSILDATIDGILVDTADGRILSVNRRFSELWQLPQRLDWRQDSAALFGHVGQLLEQGFQFAAARAQLPAGPGQAEQRLVLRLKDGRVIEQVVRGVQLGLDPARLWSFRDITERHHVEQRELTRRQVLELLATGADLPSVLEAVVKGVEAGNPAMLCSILLLDEDGQRIVLGAAPSLPAFFNAAVHGMMVDGSPGSCARALREGRRVIVEDIRADPLWAPLRDLAASARLGACWSEPIRGSSGKLLGSFAIYHRRPHAPSPANIALIEEASHLAGMAIEQAQAAVALRAGEARFRSLYDNAPVALWEQDWSGVRAALAELELSGIEDLGTYLRVNSSEARRLAALVRVLDVNAAALTQVGAADAGAAAAAGRAGQASPRPAVGALSLAQNFDDSAMPAFALALTALAQGAHFFACESSFQRLDGATRQNELTLLVMPGHEQSLDFVIVSTVDITERKRMDADLLALATTDFLTGLPNRREFMARLDDQQARLQRGVDSAAVLMLDLDHFKTINDDHGHAAGDVVLRHVAGLMRGCQRKIDTLGRVGGEEFAVLLPGADLAAASMFAERLRHCVADTPLLLDDGSRIGVTVSIGIALMSGADRGYDAALIRADQALYCAKRAGRNRVEPGCGARSAGGWETPPALT